MVLDSRLDLCGVRCRWLCRGAGGAGAGVHRPARGAQCVAWRDDGAVRRDSVGAYELPPAGSRARRPPPGGPGVPALYWCWGESPRLHGGSGGRGGAGPRRPAHPGQIAFRLLDLAEFYYPIAPGSKAFGRLVTCAPFPAATLGVWRDKVRLSPFYHSLAYALPGPNPALGGNAGPQVGHSGPLRHQDAALEPWRQRSD